MDTKLLNEAIEYLEHRINEAGPDDVASTYGMDSSRILFLRTLRSVVNDLKTGKELGSFESLYKS